MTAHPTAHWTLQQLREAIPSDHSYRFPMHDRDSIFSAQLDRSIRHLGLMVLKTPPQSPQVRAYLGKVTDPDFNFNELSERFYIDAGIGDGTSHLAQRALVPLLNPVANP